MFRIRSFFKELEPTRQMSEAFRNCIFLALSGGFQDAYTYFTRDGVFANAQTGNVVLMSTNFMTGKWGEGLKYLFPFLPRSCPSAVPYLKAMESPKYRYLLPLE